MIQRFTYDIIATGSTGNAVLITVHISQSSSYHILIDMGISYKRLKEAFEKASFVFITHEHQDHLNLSAYNKLKEHHPRTTIITNKAVSDKIKVHGYIKPTVIIEDFQTFYIGDLKITALPNEHNVECQGYIFEYDGQVLLYATDLSTTLHYKDYLEEKGLLVDILLLEGNYRYDVFRYYVHIKGDSMIDLFNNGSSRHLEIGEYNEFKDQFLKPEGQSEMLHQSSTYATPEGLVAKMNSEAKKRNDSNGTHYKTITIEDFEKWKKNVGKM